MAEPTPTETKADPLNDAITNLFVVCNEIQDRYCNTNKQQPYWSSCANKLHASYVRVADSSAYRDMFLAFHQKYGRDYCVNIFGTAEGEEDDVHDDFFKSMEVFTAPGKSKTSAVPKKGTAAAKKNASWRGQPTLKGPVIYYTYEDEKAAGVCLPVGEIYRVTISMFEQMENDKGDDMDVRSLPARLLCAFYKVIYVACGEFCEGADIMKSNLELLEQNISDVTIHTTDNSGPSSGPFGVLKDVFKRVVPALTKGGKDSLIPKEAQTAIENVIKGDTIDDVGNMFAQISGSIQRGADKAQAEGKVGSVTSILDSISDTLKTQPVVDTMQNIAGKISSLTGDGILAPPTAEQLAAIPKPTESTAENNAEDQS